MAEFAHATDIQTQLDAWLNADTPLVIRLPATVGQREDRYFHALGSPTDLEVPRQEAILRRDELNKENQTLSPNLYEQLVSRIEALEARVTELEGLIK